MSQQRFDDDACQTLAGCVKEIESNTDAELVIVVRGRSGSYLHADLMFGFVLSFITVLFLVFSPVDFHPYWIPIDIVALFVVGAFISSRSHFLRRLFSTRKFRDKSVRTAAAAMFYEAGIANTNAEMGLLIYLSLLERKLELIADRGVLKKVPAQEWNHQLADFYKVGEHPNASEFQNAIRTLGKMLTSHIPATGENPNELPDMPRFEL